MNLIIPPQGSDDAAMPDLPSPSNFSGSYAQWDTYNRFARSLYVFRCKAGLTQEELATRSGTTSSMITRIEDGNMDGCSIELLGKIACALECRILISLFYPPKKEVGPCRYPQGSE